MGLLPSKGKSGGIKHDDLDVGAFDQGDFMIKVKIWDKKDCLNGT